MLIGINYRRSCVGSQTEAHGGEDGAADGEISHGYIICPNLEITPENTRTTAGVVCKIGNHGNGSTFIVIIRSITNSTRFYSYSFLRLYKQR